MLRKLNWPSFAVLLTLLAFGAASYWPLKTMWGINHLQFLSREWVVAYGATVAAAVFFLFRPFPLRLIDPAVNRIDSWLWGEKIWWRLIFVLCCTILFYFYRVETHFLGDGYTWLAIFGRSESYIHKWAEPGSILLLRWMQKLIGGYTRETALAAFQIMSIASGAVVVANLISIVGQLCGEASVRILGLLTLLFSGSLLLFFGYVEFYPISFAACTTFLNLSIRSLRQDRLVWYVPVVLLIAILVHIQALYFLPALAYLLLNKLRHPVARKVGWTLFAVFALVGIAAIVWLYATRIEFEVLLLPFFEGRPDAPNYTIFSFPHLIDVANETLLVLPGGLVLLTLWLSHGPRIRGDSLSVFLGLASTGSLAFLFLFGAAVTMGRDWDVMSLTILAPILLIIYQLGGLKDSTSSRILPAYLLVCGLLSLSFLGVSTEAESSEKRCRTLLNSHNRGSWLMFANYLREKEDDTTFLALTREVAETFPQYRTLAQANAFIESGYYEKARDCGHALVDSNSYNPDFLHVLGKACAYLGQYDSAAEYYSTAISLTPYHAARLHELGRVYMVQQKYDRALKLFKRAYTLSLDRTDITESLALAHVRLLHYDTALVLADSLFLSDANSPGGHLTCMLVALQRNDTGLAQHHFEGYLKYGTKRPDYQVWKRSYMYLVE